MAAAAEECGPVQKKKTEQNSLSRRRTDVSCYIRAAFFKVLVSVNRFLQRRERQRRTSRVARPATDLAVGRNSSVSFRPAINFLFLSSSLMAHFNSKLNTLAALISPNLAGRHLRVASFRNFFFQKCGQFRTLMKIMKRQDMQITCTDGVLNGRALVQRDLIVTTHGTDGAAQRRAQDGTVRSGRTVATHSVRRE